MGRKMTCQPAFHVQGVWDAHEMHDGTESVARTLSEFSSVYGVACYAEATNKVPSDELGIMYPPRAIRVVQMWLG